MRRKMFENIFERGINTLDDPYSIKDSYVREMDNLIPSVGSPMPRKGHELVTNKYSIHADATRAFEYKNVFGTKNILIQSVRAGAISNAYWSDGPSTLKQIKSFDLVPLEFHSSIKFFNVGSSIGFTSALGLFIIEDIGGELMYRRTYRDSSDIKTWWVSSNTGLSASLMARPNTIYPHNRPGSINYKDSSKNLKVIEYKDSVLVWGYLITMVRHAVTTPIINSYIPGLLESSALLEKDIRHYVTMPEPVSTMDSTKTPYGTSNGFANGSIYNYAIDNKSGQLYSNLKSTASSALDVGSGVDPTWGRTSFKYYNANDCPASIVNLPKYAVDEDVTGYITIDPALVAIYYASIKKEFTHWRIYRTTAQSSIDAVDGSEFRHLVDVAIDPLVSTFSDNVTDSELTGSLGKFHFWGTQPAPGCNSSKYEFGSVWCSDILPSTHCFYSMRPQEFGADEKWIGHFRTDTDWFQVSPYYIKHVDRIGDDIFILTDRNIFYIPKGQPSISPPILLTDEAGIAFVSSIQRIRNGLYFLSTSGPAVLRNGRLELLEAFRDARVYPKLGNNLSSRKESNSLNTLTSVETTVINGIWVLHLNYSGTKQFLCYVEEPEQGYVGCFTISSIDTWIDNGYLVTNSFDGYLIGSNAGANSLVKLMSTNSTKDVINIIRIKLRTKAQWVYPEQKDFQGDAFSLKIISSGTDVNPYLLKVYSEENLVASNEAWYRWYMDGSYNETNHAISSYAFQDGIVGTNYAFYIEKLLTNDWYLNGIEFTFIPRKRKIGVGGSTAFVNLVPEGVGYDVIQGIEKQLPVY